MTAQARSRHDQTPIIAPPFKRFYWRVGGFGIARQLLKWRLYCARGDPSHKET